MRKYLGGHKKGKKEECASQQRLYEVNWMLEKAVEGRQTEEGGGGKAEKAEIGSRDPGEVADTAGSCNGPV